MNLLLVQQTLRDEGCPEEVVCEVVGYCKSHPDTSLADINRHLDKIATQYGHSNYQEFKRAGFRKVRRDEILVSAIYSPA